MADLPDIYGCLVEGCTQKEGGGKWKREKKCGEGIDG